MGSDQGALPLSRRFPARRALLALLPLAPAVAAPLLTGAARDAGTGYRLENVEILDPLMRLEDARRYMIRFNEALGVQCRDCHDLRDFASDEKPLKLAAREMMKLEIGINETWFPEATEPAVTCWTCHRGARIPPVEGSLVEGSLEEMPSGTVGGDPANEGETAGPEEADPEPDEAKSPPAGDQEGG